MASRALTSKSTSKPKKPTSKPKPNKVAALDPARRQALLEAVLAEPDSDGPRRVYADALIGAGDPRGDFIAVQCELAARGNLTEREDPKSKPLWTRFRELHSKHSAKWTKPLRALGKPTKWQFHRGFVRALALDCWSETLTPAGLAAILATEPVLDLELGGSEATITALLDVAGIERLRRLGIYSQGAFVAQAPAAAPRLTAVTELRLGIALDDAGLDALAGTTGLRSVRHLAIAMSTCSDAAFARLASSRLGRQLETFEWCRAEVTAGMAAAVVAMPALTTFVASTGWCDSSSHVLRARFEDRFVVESEAGDDYVLGGVPGVSQRVIA